MYPAAVPDAQVAAVVQTSAVFQPVPAVYESNDGLLNIELSILHELALL